MDHSTHGLLGAPFGQRRVRPDRIITLDATPGVYCHSAGVAANPDGSLVCIYRRSDAHCAVGVAVWAAYSNDEGFSWHGHRELTRLTFENDRAVWVAPQLGWSQDRRRLFIIIDRGEKKSAEDWPVLSDWQKPDRGMSNWLMESTDGGKTWTPPRKIDDVGGEPSYIIELSNGSLLYTRTDSAPTFQKKNPEMPWGNNYYRNIAVFSDDAGITWGTRTSILADDPLQSDAEVGVVEYAPGKLLAVTRTGCTWFSGVPSRFFLSDDFGKTWSKPILSPIYGHRACVRQLASGKLLMTYRNMSGTTGSCALLFDPAEVRTLGFQPNCTIWDERCCTLAGGAMQLRTREGGTGAVQFNLYPLEDDDSAIELEVELAVPEADTHACLISAGALARFMPDCVSLADRPNAGFAINAAEFHRYRLAYKAGQFTIDVDGELRLAVAADGLFLREVRFGNRTGGATLVRPAESPPLAAGYHQPGDSGFRSNAGVSLWRSIACKVSNRRDHSVTWSWSADSGMFPDQFRRDRVLMLERNAGFAWNDNGYSGWCQAPSGRILVADYTRGEQNLPTPAARVYQLKESDLEPV